MATENPTPPEGTTEVQTQNDNGDVETIYDLPPGEVVDGTVVDVREYEGNYGTEWMVRINDDERGVVDLSAHDEVKTAIREDELRTGRDVWIGRDAEPTPIDNDDIEADEYHATKCRLYTVGDA